MVAAQNFRRRIRFIAGLAIASLFVVASTNTMAPTHVAAQAHRVGDGVEVSWNGTWYNATVLVVNRDGTFRIHYDGWEASWDENVPPARIRARTGGASSAPPPAAAPAAAPAAGSNPPGQTEDPGGTPVVASTALTPGQSVQVSWNGRWYNATVIRLVGRNVRIHYDGWADSWDGNVPRNRIRVGGTVR
jgi:sRNA-binding protein